MFTTSRFVKLCHATVLAAAVACVAVPVNVHAAPAGAYSVASAINKSGRQRLLSQRVVKAYCQVLLGVQPAVSQKLLQDSINLFDTQLLELGSVTTKPELQQAWAKESEAWLKVRAVVQAAPSSDGVRKLNELGDGLLETAQKLTQLLENESGKKAGYWINVAGRQRMLSQRIAKFYMLKKAGVGGAEVSNGLEKARTEFLTNHDGLVAGAANNPHIVAELRLAKSQWNYLDMALRNEGAEQMDSVAATSERLLDVLDRITGMFEAAYASN